MKKLLAFLLLLGVTTAYAGVNGVTHHSRANCGTGGFNESVSWDLLHAHWFWVDSNHYNARTGELLCSMVSNWQQTWRNAQYHMTEGYGGWLVDGFHWMPDSRGAPVLQQRETVTDCSIYDGWWNY